MVLSVALKVLAGIFFFGTVSVFLWASNTSKGVYDEYIESLDEKEFKLKQFLNVGLLLDEKVNLFRLLPNNIQPLMIRYSNSVLGNLTEIYGYRYLQYYKMIHNGSKWTVFLLGFIGGTAFSGICCITNQLNNAVIFLALSPIIGIGMALLIDKELNDKIEKRRISIQMDFPEFINKLLLLVNAGMTIPRAWEKIITDNKKKTPLYEELNVSLAEIRAGKSEAAAYEEFARRCKIREIIKFVSVIILNLKKGGAEIVPTLRAQADECWEMRKSAAKRLGEQASSKLMLPMAIMLLGIIMIVALPAVLQLTAT